MYCWLVYKLYLFFSDVSMSYHSWRLREIEKYFKKKFVGHCLYSGE